MNSKEKRLMNHIDKLEIELDLFNKKYRELQGKFKLAIEMIQKIDPTKSI